MKWLARFLLLVLSVSLLSCSALSVIYLHNDTSNSLDYTITATFDHKLEKPVQSEGTIQPNEVAETITYFNSKVEALELVYTQGKTIHRINFEPDQLPLSMRNGSSGGTWSNVKVGPSGVKTGSGSGNWGADFRHEQGFLFIPCMGIWIAMIVAACAAIGSLLKRRRAHPL